MPPCGRPRAALLYPHAQRTPRPGGAKWLRLQRHSQGVVFRKHRSAAAIGIVQSHEDDVLVREYPQFGIHAGRAAGVTEVARRIRSEEHTSELQSRQYLVCRLLLEKKNISKSLLIAFAYGILGLDCVQPI